METDYYEIDEGMDYVGYKEAFNLVTSNVSTVAIEELPLSSGVGRITAEDLVARVSYPTTNVSLKDGFAVKSRDVAGATMEKPVSLKVTGSVFAGSSYEGSVAQGTAVKICSGAPIPRGAEAVVSEEFCEEISAGLVSVRADAEVGRNVLRAGAEVMAGATIVKKGNRLLPGYMGLAAAAGINKVNVYRRPHVAVIGVGDEVVAPGENLSSGQLYASNLVTMVAWLSSFGISCVTSVVGDNDKDIKRELQSQLSEVDVILTSGGAWGSERDLVIGSLDELGWQEKFHHVRMGPGKGIAFGLWDGKPVFCLPGGPASNEMAFLQLALPGVLRMSGDPQHPLQTVSAVLTESLKTRHQAWTEFKDAVLIRDAGGVLKVGLYRNRSRLQAIASANSLVCIPEGTEGIESGEVVPVQILAHRLDEL